MMETKPLGSVVGAIAGLIFVTINAGAVPGAVVWRVAAVLAFLAIIWFVVIRGPKVQQAQPTRAAVRIYGIAVVAMVVAIPVGAKVLTALDRPNAVPVWVVFAVGAHFLPFSRAFQLPTFRWLALTMILVAVAGAIPMVSNDNATAAGWAGVAAGFVLFFFSAVGPRLTNRAT